MSKSIQQLQAEEQFLISVREHIRYVQIASTELNKVLDNPEKISYNEMLTHDASKFSDAEFPHYARNFFGAKDDKIGFDSAWMNHVEKNAHHWNHWLEDFYVVRTEQHCTPIPMPLEQISIMIADWLAAGRQYQNCWDFTYAGKDSSKPDWLNDNLGGYKPKINIHKDTHKQIDSILDRIGYNTICDNSPQYCLMNPHFINKLNISELSFKLKT